MTEPLPAYHYRGLYRVSKIAPCQISLADLRRLYMELDVKNGEELERDLPSLSRPPEMDDAAFNELKVQIRDGAHLTVTVLGADGEQLAMRSVEGLSEHNVPEKITQITFDSGLAMQYLNVTPQNRFTLRLDFTEPPGFDAYNPYDQPTPNNSQLEVYGSDQTWVTAVYESTLAFFRRRGRKVNWLHRHESFNILSWLIGIPGSLWIAYRFDSSFFVSAPMHTALRGALNVYLVLFGFLVFRGILWGFRWIFPVVELERSRSRKARGVLGAILSSLLLALLYDVLATLWNPGS